MISFESSNSAKNSRSSHILQEHLSQQKASAQAQEAASGDSENPLLQYNNYRNTNAVGATAGGGVNKKDK